jgi:hypothetical protein
VEIGCGEGKKKEIGGDGKERGEERRKKKRRKIEIMNYLIFILTIFYQTLKIKGDNYIK